MPAPDPTGQEVLRVVSLEPGVDWRITALVASTRPRRIWVELEHTVAPAEAVGALFASLGIPRNT